MKLNQLSDQDLRLNLESLVQEERELLTVILHHLREVERRRLFSAHRCASLFEYAVTKLGYSEDQACRRIAAMRLMKELPEIEEKIADGSLSLSNLGLAQSLFRKEAKLAAPVSFEVQSVVPPKPTLSKEEKLKILETLEHKSSREAQKIVLSHSSDPKGFVTEKIRPVSENLSEVRFTASQTLLEKIDRLKGLFAHKHPELTLSELFEKLCDLGLEQLDPGREPKRAVPATSRVETGEKQTAKQPTRYIPAGLRREVWKRDHGRCRNCGTRRALEIDHVLPFAMGGDTSPENLRLLCR